MKKRVLSDILEIMASDDPFADFNSPDDASLGIDHGECAHMEAELGTGACGNQKAPSHHTDTTHTLMPRLYVHATHTYHHRTTAHSEAHHTLNVVRTYGSVQYCK